MTGGYTTAAARLACGAMNIAKEFGPETIQHAADRTAREIASELKIAFEREGWI